MEEIKPGIQIPFCLTPGLNCAANGSQVEKLGGVHTVPGQAQRCAMHGSLSAKVCMYVGGASVWDRKSLGMPLCAIVCLPPLISVSAVLEQGESPLSYFCFHSLQLGRRGWNSVSFCGSQERWNLPRGT